MSITLRRLTGTVAFATISLAVLSACGSSSPADSSDSSAPLKMTVGLVAVADYSPVTYALDKGYFTDEGLDVKTQVLAGGAAAIPGLLSGDLQVATTNWVSFIQAVDQNAPVTALPIDGTVAAPGIAGIYARGDSNITDLSDLSGKSVAMTELKTITEFTTRVALEENGVASKDVKFTTLPFATILPAVDKGEVDAGWMVEPYASQSKALGLKQVVDLFAGKLKAKTTGGYITSTKFAQSNPDALKRYAAAVDHAVADMKTNPALVEDTLIGMKAMQEKQRGTTTLPTFGPALTADDLTFWAGLMADQGFLKSSDLDLGKSLVDLG